MTWASSDPKKKPVPVPPLRSLVGGAMGLVFDVPVGSVLYAFHV